MILIAVALFAALSWAVTRSGRGGNSTITREQDQLTAALVFQRLAHLQNEFQRFGLSIGSTALVQVTDPDGTCAGAESERCFWAPDGGNYDKGALMDGLKSIGACGESWCDIVTYFDSYDPPPHNHALAPGGTHIVLHYMKRSICIEMLRVMDKDLTMVENSSANYANSGKGHIFVRGHGDANNFEICQIGLMLVPP